MHPLLPLADASIETMRECQQNDSLVDLMHRQSLKKGKAVEVPEYDFRIHCRKGGVGCGHQPPVAASPGNCVGFPSRGHTRTHGAWRDGWNAVAAVAGGATDTRRQ